LSKKYLAGVSSVGSTGSVWPPGRWVQLPGRAWHKTLTEIDMPKVIYKYPLSFTSTEISMPYKAEVLSVRAQDGAPVLWAIVDNDCPDKELRTFETYATGFSTLPENPGRFLGTFEVADGKGFFVGHVFETTGIATQSGDLHMEI
jgi:hypothetical protein